MPALNGPVVPRKVAPLSEQGYGQQKAFWWTSPDQLEETAEVAWPWSVSVYERMRRQDSQVMAVLRAVTLPLRRTPWRIDKAGAKAKVAKLVSEDLGLPLVGAKKITPPPRTRDRFSWSDHLRLALLQLVFGHAYFEQLYRIDVDGFARLRKLAYRQPHTISRFDIADDGGLEAIYQFPMPGDDNERRMDISRLVAYVNDREGGNWAGQSLLRTAFGPWVLKQKAERSSAISVDRNGNGVPIYTNAPVPEGITGKDEIREWQEKEMDAGTILAQAYRGGENAGSAIPHGATLQFPGVSGKQPDIRGWLDFLDGQIGRSVLAHFLDLGDQTGSYALGETFESFFTLSLQTIAQQVADIATQHVVEDWVDINFGPDEPAPRITFDEIGSRHPTTAEAIMSLVQCGALMPDDQLEAYLRTMYGLPEIDAKTRRVKADPKPPANDEPPAEQQPEQPEPEPDESENE